ncbi:hypothetical protein BC832DRAFT_566370 [Gaertneriomyces semiglobifer]|nr:hypothetical protein BC832DRAFT_566370 [Gaertneriomyces semiglobifer]
MSYQTSRRGGRGASYGNQGPPEYDGYGRGRGGRGGTFRGRGSGRGRGSYSGGSGYIDTDGDVMMGDTSARHDSRRGNTQAPGGRGNPTTSQTFPGAPDEVLIQGFPPADTDLDRLATFVLSRASTPVEIKQMLPQGDSVLMKLAHAGQANTVAQLNGIRFRGLKLLVLQGGNGAGSGMSSQSSTGGIATGGPRLGTIEAFQALLQSRYLPDGKFLNLEAMIGDPILKHIGFRGFEPASKAGGVICKLISTMFPNVETISFASNDLVSLEPFSMLPQYVPNIRALSFQDNRLRSYRDIEPLKGSSFGNLRELLFTGNPVVKHQLSKPGGDIEYRSTIKSMFPSIEVLDMQPVIGDITFAVDTASVELPVKALPGFFDSPQTAATAQDFLQKFFSLFDSNRRTLYDLYDDQACFSLSVDTQTRGTPRANRYFDGWNTYNHNLHKSTDVQKRVGTLQRGSEAIIRCFERLPRTKHPVDAPVTEKKFLTEGYQTGAGGDAMLFVMVHGEFGEEISGGARGFGRSHSELRSFDRTFIIVPAAPGSRAAMAGLPYVVINDQWTLRQYAGNSAWYRLDQQQQADARSATQGGASPAPQLPNMTTLRQLQLNHQLDDARQNAVIEFAKATGLNYQFSLQCLSETGWQLPAAMQAYQNVKNNIPPEAYKLT